MKKSFYVFLLICLFFLTSCMPKPSVEKAKITLYYANKDNDKILSEEREITLQKGESLPKRALEELLKGPTSPELRNNIPAETKILDLDIKDKIATVNFSKEFSQFPGIMAESFAIISVVNTLTEFPEIEKVHILVDGKELIAPSGMPYGLLKRYDLASINNSIMNKTTITLYFSDDGANYLVPEYREVVKDKPLEQIIVEELIKGPQQPGHYKTIPPETKLLSIKVENGTAVVNFSKELKTKHWGGSTGEAFTIFSIVNSLTELPEIKKVEFLIEGKKEETLAGHMIFNEPFTRNENMIKK
ncbi:MAG: GerMN domain-containing protein [Thermovenabulum sp.]|uniref:GerMN domain-containing protein n=2 Tax=Thermovenabulum sp. TaxID=3100335 RepID=UPI003C7B0715